MPIGSVRPVFQTQSARQNCAWHGRQYKAIYAGPVVHQIHQRQVRRQPSAPSRSSKARVCQHGGLKGVRHDQINNRPSPPLLEEANRPRIKVDLMTITCWALAKKGPEARQLPIGIFESKDLDFSKHRADGDDILGDAYMIPDATSPPGKWQSKGQFYTPAEVSRVMAQVLGHVAKTSPDTTVVRPDRGSSSLLLKVAEAAPPRGERVCIARKRKKSPAARLRMNMILPQPRCLIEQGQHPGRPKVPGWRPAPRPSTT